MDEMTDAEFLKHLADWQDDENRRSESVGMLLNIPLTERLRRIADRLEPPWVSVDELPDHPSGQAVLTRGSHDEPITAYYVNKRWYSYEDDEWLTGITHWMIIPPIEKQK